MSALDVLVCLLVVALCAALVIQTLGWCGRRRDDGDQAWERFRDGRWR